MELSFQAQLAGIIFLVAYGLITLERFLGTHKAPIAMAAAALVWVVASFALPEEILHEKLVETMWDVGEIVFFLWAAMGIVEALDRYQLFDIIRGKLLQLKFTERKQYLAVCFLSFFLSAVIDNLTTTLVMSALAARFFSKENLLVVIASIVVVANAGGAWSPIGDVTTIMLWLADKFSAAQIVTEGILPSLAIALTAVAMLYPKVKESSFDVKNEVITSLKPSEKAVISLGLASFSLPFVFSQLGLSPAFGLILGFGLVWLLVDYFKMTKEDERETHLEREIRKLIKAVDSPSLWFFVGILFAVGGLEALGVLEYISQIIFGEDPSFWRMVTASGILGVLSAVIDNVPLTAVVIDMLQTDLTDIWILFAITVGTGGSLLVIGSAAGVVAMGRTEELKDKGIIEKTLDFFTYIKIAFLPALISYLVGVVVWILQFYLVKGGI